MNRRYHNPSIAINIKGVSGEIKKQFLHGGNASQDTPGTKHEESKSETGTLSECNVNAVELDSQI